MMLGYRAINKMQDQSMENNLTDTSKHIEALLFWKGEPMSIKEISKSLGVGITAIEAGLLELKESLKNRGLTLMENGEDVQLGTSADSAELIQRLTKEELAKDLGKASLETLAIIFYKGPLRRSEIDHIRGVNSTFIIRNLLIRGLIDKKPAPGDQRASIYSTSFELLSYLGIAKAEDMPGFAKVQEEIKAFQEHAAESSRTNTDTTPSTPNE